MSSSHISFQSLVCLSANREGSKHKFGPRGGKVLIRNGQIAIDTPGVLTCTSRGVVPHLSRDNVKRTRAIKWVHIPFESFLEHRPPIPTLQPQSGETPRINTLLGFPQEEYVLSMSLRNSADGQEMPANTNAYVTANCIRGMRKASLDWRSYVDSCKPDIIFSLSDTPFTPAPYSQKRLTKSIERSALWLADMLQYPETGPITRPGNIFVQMAGGASAPARSAFAESLVEGLQGKEAEAMRPLKCLDEGVAGYVVEMVPLRLSIQGFHDPSPNPATVTSLIQASLSSLSLSKPRLVTCTRGPHEIIRLVCDVGVDLFDTHWAQHAADVGVALDFHFPAPKTTVELELGHNLYDTKYERDFTSFTSHDLDSSTFCPCPACSPSSVPSSEIIRHSFVDEPGSNVSTSRNPSYTKAFLHHLLHTHEMSAHSLLAMHNITVMDAFFAGIRQLISQDDLSLFEAEVDRFFETYAEDTETGDTGARDERNMLKDDTQVNVFKAAEKAWKEVELLRGKGRLARENEKAKAESTTAANAILTKEMEEKGIEGGSEAVVPMLPDTGL
ncbi:tRNA-guanine(15) transglycosylase-like protein [Rhodocollybia butyracea]|uniref:tRNA-guanine(15) transglycosylase-like protein n=1 Tax=Rhodocollybia butyracea TaxID=206335 RepID=A0A9P5U982_9AGAR|nr:tRNA-guanine(15) transglycosylase-like protein [Rhodocollybia butyracea]